MDNLGAPVAYLILPDNVPVYDNGGEQVGVVDRVLADESSNIFHGLVVRRPGIPDTYRFAARDQVAELYERGVTLAVPADHLPEPSEDAVAAEATHEGLQRAWDWLNRPR